jgi:mycothiol synthase
MVIVGNTASKRVAEKCGFKFEVVVLHRAAFGTPHMTIEGQLSWMRMPEYDPTLDLVAVAPDGALAAYVLCSISEQENLLAGRRVGYTDSVATHPKFQRRGLAKALLVKGLNLLRQRGMEIAGL